MLGYIEEGTTTTPWSMLRLNNVSRFTLADLAVQRISHHNPGHKIGVQAHELGSYWKHQLVKHEEYVLEHGEDPEWCGKIPEVGAEMSTKK